MPPPMRPPVGGRPYAYSNGSNIVGGLSRTIPFQGNRFDIGPHRFFTKNAEVRELFKNVLGDEAIRVTRQTRILNDRKYFDYPLTPVNAILGVGSRQEL